MATHLHARVIRQFGAIDPTPRYDGRSPNTNALDIRDLRGRFITNSCAFRCNNTRRTAYLGISAGQSDWEPPLPL